uniref:J domain-containing protein n=1 Tax=viral metagenome TaxID=1070528 RepID=A0A6C0CRZ8_9ZZZZ
MDLQQACDILNLTPQNFNKQSIKKAYYRLALKCHPDKCKDANSNEKFRNVTEAYQFLCKHVEIECTDTQEESYSSMFAKFVSSTTGIEINEDSVTSALHGIKKGYQKLTVEMFKELNRSDSLQLYSYLERYSSLLGLDSCSLREIEVIMKEKMEKDELIILKPALNNLFSLDIYPLTHKEETYYIPLWHNELEYDLPSKSLIVRIIPNVPDNIIIDENNSIHVDVVLDIKDIFHKDLHDIYVGNKVFQLKIRDLQLKPLQTIIFKQRGIPQIDTKNFFSYEKIGDVIIHLELINK